MSYNNYLDADAAYSAVCDYAGADSGPDCCHLTSLPQSHHALLSSAQLRRRRCEFLTTSQNSDQMRCLLADPTCVVVKHTNPCGIASREDLKEAYRLAVRADPISAFGGIVAFNR